MWDKARDDVRHRLRQVGGLPLSRKRYWSIILGLRVE